MNQQQSNIDARFTELLNPVKDPEKAFDINIADSLHEFMDEFRSEKMNFNSAALVVQGSSNIYGKKVDYLHEQTKKLLNHLGKLKKADELEKQENKEKEKTKSKASKIDDLYISTEIKVSKSLSCLKNKSAGSDKKPKKLLRYPPPPCVVPIDDDLKGEPFYDVKGQYIDRKGAYALNECTLTSSGWLVLPGMNLDIVKSFSESSGNNSAKFPSENTNVGNEPAAPVDMNESSESLFPTDSDQPLGLDTSGYITATQSTDNPASQPDPVSELPSSTPSGQASPSSSDKYQGSSDEGFCSESAASPPKENIPAPGTNAAAVSPIRRSSRQALRDCQLENNKKSSKAVNHDVKEIQKKSTRSLPSRLKTDNGNDSLCTISEFCARTFFYPEKAGYDNEAFALNTNFFKRLKERTEYLKSEFRKIRSNLEDVNEDEEIDVEDTESMRDADNTLCIDTDGDIHIEICPPLLSDLPDAAQVSPVIDEMCVAEPVSNNLEPNLDPLGEVVVGNYLEEIRKYVHTNAVAERVRAWKEEVEPYLEELEQREPFNIDEYGSRLLNAFEDNDAKQTITFRSFCARKKPWEIVRYFMALLSLINNENVSIETEPISPDCDEIFITLQSRKMHHKELENFGHNDGSST